MTVPHDEANARLLELVYDEASPAERKALEAHVATCAQCRTDLAALSATRAQLRAELEDAPVPTRAHARILEAAAAELAAAGNVAAAPARRGVVPPTEPSFWQRMRLKWTLPTFAVVGAVALMLIGSKVLLDPQRAAEKRQEMFPAQEGAPSVAAQRPVTPTPADQPAPSAAQEPAPEQKSADEPHGARPLSPSAQAALERARSFGPGHGSGLLGSFGAAHLGSRLAGSNASRGLAGVRPVGAASGGGAPVADNLAAGAPAPRPSPAKSAVAADGYASPPAGWRGGAADSLDRPKQIVADKPVASHAASPPPALAKKKSESNVARDEEAESAVAEESDRRAPAPRATAPASASAAGAPAEKAAKTAAKDAAASSYATLARHADELYAAHRWSEAVAAYRDLVHRWPDVAPAKRWRTRLAEAQAESARTSAPAEAK